MNDLYTKPNRGDAESTIKMQIARIGDEIRRINVELAQLKCDQNTLSMQLNRMKP